MTTTRLADVAIPSFARHETFAPRFGWLHKAFDAVSNDSGVLVDKAAPVTLGVGKNMVNAIRYWSQAFKLTREHPLNATSRAMGATPTWEAYWLLGEDGADPYLEDPASLWLLHWWLLSSKSLAPSWWIAFHNLPSARFTESELADTIMRQVRLTDWELPAPASILKDVDCITKMYAPRKAVAGSPGSFEDLLDCPFRELGLLESVDSASSGARTWRFTSTGRSSLPPAVAAFACLDYATAQLEVDTMPVESGGSISIARLASEPGSPGRAFKIREPALVNLLAQASAEHPELQITTAVGRKSLVFPVNIRDLAWRVLDAHYGGPMRKQGFLTRAQWDADRPQLHYVRNRVRAASAVGARNREQA